jgi:hypothetical protein
MNKLLLPVGLGLAAFAINMMGFGSNAGPAPVKLAAAATDIKEGEIVTAKMVDSVSAPGGSAVAKSAVPYAERGVVVIGQAARRKITKGEMLLFDDFRLQSTELQDSALAPGEVEVHLSLENIKCPSNLLQPNAQIGFVVVNRAPVEGLEGMLKSNKPPRILGPFRVVSVGGKTSSLDRESSHGGQPLTIGVAVKPGPTGNPEGIAAEIVQLVGHNAGQSGNEITAIVRFPSRKDG